MFVNDEVAVVKPTENQAAQSQKQAGRIQNPLLIFEKAMRDVQELFLQLDTKLGVSYQDFEAFLQHKQPALKEKIDQSHRRVDSDVYGRFMKNQLAVDDFEYWRTDVNEWKNNIVLGIHLFELVEIEACLRDSSLSN